MKIELLSEIFPVDVKYIKKHFSGDHSPEKGRDMNTTNQKIPNQDSTFQQ